MERELRTVADELELQRLRLDNVVGALPVGAAADSPDRELSDEELDGWLASARNEDDPGVRFSALVMLGRRRTEQGIKACTERLDDRGERPVVLWQALRNLGRFGERAAASRVAVLLDHEAVIVRSAAHDALLRMGAPETGYDAVSLAEDRAEAAAQLTAWAATAE